MNLSDKYELQGLLADGPAKTFRAIEKGSQRPVFVHIFTPKGVALLRLIEQRLLGVDGRSRRPLIDTGEFSGMPCAVTEVIEQFATLQEWATSVQPIAADSISEAPRAPGPYTRLFMDVSKAAQRRDAGDPVAAREPRPASPPAPQPAQPAGEFTRMFSPASGGPAASPPDHGSPQASEPGEFTKMFYAGGGEQPAAPQKPSPLDEFERLIAQKPAPEPDPHPPAEQKPSWPEPPAASVRGLDSSGEFSKIFGSGFSGEGIDVEAEHARARELTPPESRPFQQAGEFTRMFGPAPGAHGSAEPPTPSHTSASKIFDMPEIRERLANEAPEDKNAPNAEPRQPGEYTKMMGLNVDHPEPVGPSAPVSLAPVPANDRKRTIIVVSVIAGIVVITLVIVLILALKG